jgi:hypothetical protein
VCAQIVSSLYSKPFFDMIGRVQQHPRVAVHRVGLKSCRRRHVAARSEKDDGRGSNVGEFCSLDAAGKQSQTKSLMEKETEFLEVCRYCMFLLSSDQELEINPRAQCAGAAIVLLRWREQAHGRRI